MGALAKHGPGLAVLTAVIIALVTWNAAHSDLDSQLPQEKKYWLSRQANISYVPGSKNPAQMLDLYLPIAVNDTSKLPLIIFIHGGGWAEGDKSQAPAALLWPAGFAVASLNYRLTGEAKFPAQIYDVKAAIRWLRAHALQYNLDRNKFGVWGTSAGGHLAALLGTTGGVKELEGTEGNKKYSSAVQAVCDFYGPSDLVLIEDQAKLFGRDKEAEGYIEKFLPTSSAGIDANARAASPVTYASKDDPPFLIVHGDSDTLVPVEQSRELDELLRKNGVETQLYVVPGGGHGSSTFKNQQEVMQMVVDFFRKHLVTCQTSSCKSSRNLAVHH